MVSLLQHYLLHDASYDVALRNPSCGRDEQHHSGHTRLATLFNELFAHRPTPLRQGAKEVRAQTASHLQLVPVLRRAARRAPSAAKTSFTAAGGCKRDYALPCPKGWCLATDQACVAPFNWKGVCAIRDAALPKMTAEGKERRGTVCDTPYPCDDDFAAHQPRNIYCPDVPEDNAPPIPIAQEDAAGKNGVPPGVTRTDVIVQISNKPSQKFFQPLQEGALQNEANPNAGRPENPNVASEKLVVGEDGALHKLELMDAYHVGGPKKAMRGKAVLADGTLPYSKKTAAQAGGGRKGAPGAGKPTRLPLRNARKRNARRHRRDGWNPRTIRIKGKGKATPLLVAATERWSS